MEPVKKQRVQTTEYFSCGLEGRGHQHRTEQAAIKCINKRQNKGEYSKLCEQRRNEMWQQKQQGRSISEIARQLGVTSTTVSLAIQRAEDEQHRKQLGEENILSMRAQSKQTLVAKMPIEWLMLNVSNETRKRIQRNTEEIGGTIGDFMAMPAKIKTILLGKRAVKDAESIIFELRLDNKEAA